MSKIINVVIDSKDCEASINRIFSLKDSYMLNGFTISKLGLHYNSLMNLLLDEKFKMFFSPEYRYEKKKNGFKGHFIGIDFYSINIKEDYIQATTELFAYELLELG